MPVYVYETVLQKGDEQPERFEVYQSIHAEPLHAYPEAEVSIRRIIIGGMFIPKKSGIQHASSGGACCGTC